MDISASSYIYNDSTETRTSVKNILSEKGITDRVKNIGIVFGSNVTRNKWPLQNFIKISEYYLALDYNILLFGGADDSKDASVFPVSSKIYSFCGTFQPLETAEAMKYCCLVITNDTGPMHLSYMVKTPVVALFSSRDFPGKWYPPDDGINKVFRSENISCSICFNRNCTDNFCLKKITTY